MLPRCKVFIMRQKNSNSSQKPHKHALIFMHFFTCKTKKPQIPRPKSHFWPFILASTNYPHTHNGIHMCTIRSTSQISQNHTQMTLRHFTEHLVGACFIHEKIRNGGNMACPFISDFTIGLRPSPIVEAKLHDESKMIQRCFDDNNDDNKR